jgi:hypothetical protein
MNVHPSHVTRFSDASTFDEICTKCGATDRVRGGMLWAPCPHDARDSEPHTVSTDPPTPENDPAGRFRKP